MSDEEKRVKEIMADYTSAGAKLREIIPAFNWGNLLGDYGEYICAKNYDLSLVFGYSFDYKQWLSVR